MPVNIDSERLLTGFSTLAGGMDFGTDASLVGPDQCAFASNISFGGDLAKTRPPWISRPLDTAIRSRFQGAIVYQTLAQQGIVLAAGGHLYYITLNPTGAAMVKDVTPILSVSVTAAFTVPAPAATVMVSVASESPFTIGDVLIIDSGTYTVTNLFANALLLTYGGGAANATVASGAPILRGGVQVTQILANPANDLFVHLFQAEIYVVAMANQHRPVFFDGASARQAGIGEIPSSVLGVYAWGRIWFVLPDRRTFGAGDIVYGPSGTPSSGGVDAILKVSENDFLNEGGFFAAPNNAGEITSVMPLATIDTALGIGPILFGTTNSVFSVNAPVDRTTWKNLTYPIQTVSLLDYGPMSPRATVPVNNDMWYRSIDGVRSFIIARRDTTAPGNTPLSHEVSPILAKDTQELLFYGSSALFNNRLFTTVSPSLTDGGVTHDGVVAINFDSLSTIRGKQPPIWEGPQSGLKFLQVFRGRIGGNERCFAFALNEDADNLIELWEFLPEDTGYYDTYVSVSGINSTIVRTPIQTALESRRYNYNQLVQLRMAEIYIDEVVDEITLVIKFRPDEYPGWITWGTIHLCASVSQCTIPTPAPYTCVVWKPNARSYAARILLPEPSEACNTISLMPLNRGYEFQFRFEGTGHFRLRRFRPHTRVLPDAMTARCPPESATCVAVQDCGTSWFDYQIGRGAPVAAMSEVWRSIDGGAFEIVTVAGESSNVPLLTMGIDSVVGSIKINWDIHYIDISGGMGSGATWCYKVRGTIPTEGAFSNIGCAVRDMIYPGTGAVSQPTWMVAFGDFASDDITLVTSVSFPALVLVTGTLFLDAGLILASVDLSNLQRIGNEFYIDSGQVITSISLPSLTTCVSNMFFDGCPNLTTVSIPQLVLLNGKTYAFDSCALTAASVAHILARAVASGVTSATIFLDGGTNAGLASLSAQGQADYASLISSGNTVSINP